MSSDAQNVECPQCGRSVSSYVKTCPQCGYKLFRKRKWRGLMSKKPSLRDSQRNVIDRAKAREIAEDERSAQKKPTRPQAASQWPETSFKEPEPGPNPAPFDAGESPAVPDEPVSRPAPPPPPHEAPQPSPDEPRGGTPPESDLSASEASAIPEAIEDVPDVDVPTTADETPAPDDETQAGTSGASIEPGLSPEMGTAPDPAAEEEQRRQPTWPEEEAALGSETSATASEAQGRLDGEDSPVEATTDDLDQHEQDSGSEYADDEFVDYEDYDDQPRPVKRNQNGVLMLLILVIMAAVGGIRYLMSVWGG